MRKALSALFALSLALMIVPDIAAAGGPPKANARTWRSCK
jgi:hypothetical protein